MMEKQLSQIQLKDTVGVICEECANPFFEERFIIRKISRLLTGSPKDIINTMPVLACAKCGHVNDDMNPLNTLKDEDPV